MIIGVRALVPRACTARSVDRAVPVARAPRTFAADSTGAVDDATVGTVVLTLEATPAFPSRRCATRAVMKIKNTATVKAPAASGAHAFPSHSTGHASRAMRRRRPRLELRRRLARHQRFDAAVHELAHLPRVTERFPAGFALHHVRQQFGLAFGSEARRAPRPSSSRNIFHKTLQTLRQASSAPEIIATLPCPSGSRPVWRPRACCSPRSPPAPSRSEVSRAIHRAPALPGVRIRAT